MSEPKVVFSPTVLKKKENNCATSDRDNANAQSGAGVTGAPAPTASFQVRFETSEPVQNNRGERELHISQAESAGETLKRAHSAIQELDWLWRSC